MSIAAGRGYAVIVEIGELAKDVARNAIMIAGVVAKVIQADAAFAASMGAIPGDGASIGDAWDGSTFTPPPPVVDLEALRGVRIEWMRPNPDHWTPYDVPLDPDKRSGPSCSGSTRAQSGWTRCRQSWPRTRA